MSPPEPGGSQRLSGVRQQRSRGDCGAVRCGAREFYVHTEGPGGRGTAGCGVNVMGRAAGPRPAPARPALAAAAPRPAGSLGPGELERRGLCMAPHRRAGEARARAAAATRRAGVHPRPGKRGPREHSPQGLQGVQDVPLHASFGPELRPSHGRLAPHCSSL